MVAAKKKSGQAKLKTVDDAKGSKKGGKGKKAAKPDVSPEQMLEYYKMMLSTN